MVYLWDINISCPSEYTHHHTRQEYCYFQESDYDSLRRRRKFEASESPLVKSSPDGADSEALATEGVEDGSRGEPEEDTITLAGGETSDHVSTTAGPADDVSEADSKQDTLKQQQQPEQAQQAPMDIGNFLSHFGTGPFLSEFFGVAYNPWRSINWFVGIF